MRDRRGRYQPGQSGNPGGRPRGDQSVREAAQLAAHQAVRLLLDLARDHRAT